MDKRVNKLPTFKNIKEEALFWDTHSIADYLSETKAVRVAYLPIKERKETMTLRIAPSLKRELEKIAHGYDISSSSLIRMWVVDKLRTARS